MSTMSISRAEARELLDFCEKNNLDEFFIAKDRGAYMGAFVAPNNRVIQYVPGCNPEKDPDWWEAAEHKFGGDDFGERLPTSILKVFFGDPARAKQTRFSLRITATKILLP